MNAFETLLVHLDASPRSAVRLRLARELALRHRAEVTAMFAIEPRFTTMPTPFSAVVMAPALIPQTDRGPRDRARALFDRIECGLLPPGSAQPARVLMRWAEVVDALPLPEFVVHALCADLLLLGQHDPEDADTFDVRTDFVESVLMATGKPALVLPRQGEVSALDGCVVVAWRATRESARALAAALPFLQSARQVHVLGAADELPGRLLGAYLDRHGIDAQLEPFEAPASDAGERLLARAGELGADLLVMGCYGHSRLRERVLGGATRSVLQHMTLPLLLVH